MGRDRGKLVARLDDEDRIADRQLEVTTLLLDHLRAQGFGAER
jgi:hypothetical protein